MRNRVLLTGASGFVGRQVLKNLIENGCLVTVVIRVGTRLTPEDVSKVESVIFTDDIFSESHAWWIETMKHIDTVIHTAWFTDPGEYLQSAKNFYCLEGTLLMAKAALDANVRRFIGIGTCFEYDLSYEILSVETPLKPVTFYAQAKALAFTEITNLFLDQEIEFVWCRLFYLHGEGEKSERLVPYIRRMLENDTEVELSKGNQIRDYLDVQTAAKMIVKVALSKFQGPVNICSGVPVTIRELAENIASEYGKLHLLQFGARDTDSLDPPRVVGLKNWGAE
jgi:nucleoside-diphosphate-sugar epimerase